MNYSIQVKKHVLNFKFDAGTSRGVLTEKVVYYIIIKNEQNAIAIGEAGILPGLSIDDVADYEKQLLAIIQQIPKESIPAKNDLKNFIYQYVPESFPSVRFALETAYLDFIHGCKRQIYQTPFFDGQTSIPINGLIWMGDEHFMRQQAEEKLALGFNCLKMKIGAIDFKKEYALLKALRERFDKEELILRVDANGAFDHREVATVLNQLAELDIHSIEQPIRAGQWPAMREICQYSPVPIALDEELIGVPDNQMEELLDLINPQYIILKPGLHGGLFATQKWIALAEQRNIGWWITSALESNIGLNAIAQLTSGYSVNMHQGLGTGQLYHNNIDSPLRIERGRLYYDQSVDWETLPKV